MAKWFTKISEKSDKELEQILTNKDHYQIEFYLDAVEVARQRGLADLIPEKVIEEPVKEINKEEQKPYRLINWTWIPWKYVFDQIGLYSLLTIILVIPPVLESGFIFVLFFIQLIVYWQINVLAHNKQIKNKRSAYFHSRLLQSTLVTLIFYFAIYLDGNPDEFGWAVQLIFFTILFLASWIISIAPYHLELKIIRHQKYYFLKWFKYSTPILVIVAFALIVFEEDLFKRDSIVHWDETSPITGEHFKGYTDIYSEYAAVINSYLKYEFNEDGRLSWISAVSNQKYCWMKPWDRIGYFGIQHEQYHFNVTEVVARMARKEIYQAYSRGASKEEILEIISNHHSKRDEMQSQYDGETDHSIISDMQSYWQFRIDSLLIEYDAYWSSEILKERPESNIKYYRDFRYSFEEQFLFLDEVMPGEEEYTHCYKVSYDDSGRMLSLSSLFLGRETSLHDDIVFEIQVDYKMDGFSYLFYDKKGQPINNKNGYHEQRITFRNNSVEISFFDINKKPVIDLDRSHKIIVRQVNDSTWTKDYYDFNQNQIQTPNGLYHLDFWITEDRTEVRENYDRFGNRISDEKGAFKKIVKRDSLGRPIYRAYRDVNDDLIIRNGYKQLVQEFNELGQIIMQSYYDENGLPMEDEKGIHKTTWAEDRYGNDSRYSRYNANGVLTEVDGYASVYRKFNHNNDLIMWVGYDTGDKLVYDENGYGKVKYEYDSMGRNFKTINYNAYDYPVDADYNATVQQREYDSLGHVVVTRSYDFEMNPKLAPRGEHFYTNSFDSNGNVIESNYFDLENNPVEVEQDVATFRYIYDKRNNKLEARFYNAEGELAHANGGISINRYKYDDRNNMIERSYYDSLDRLALFEGAARLEWDVDKHGNEIEVRYFDIHNDLRTDDVARRHSEFNDENLLVAQWNYNHMGEEPEIGVPLIRLTYDKSQNIATETFLHHNNEPFENHEGIHKYLYEYSGQTRVMEIYLDGQGNLIENPKGVAKMQSEVDSRNNIVEKKYYDSQNKLSNDTSGIAVIRYTYDLYDRIISITYLDQNLNFTRRNGYSKVVYHRERSGYIKRKLFYDENGELIENNEGIAYVEKYFDRNGGSEEENYDLSQAKEYFKENDIMNLSNVEME